MKNRAQSNAGRFLVNPYLFALIGFAVVLLGAATTLFIYFVCGPEPVVAVGSERIAALTFFLGIDAVFVAAVLLNGYEMLGWVTIETEAIHLHAPFRPTITLLYEDAAHIGMDFCMLSVSKQFWIFVSKDPSPDCYRHRINHLKASPNTIRIQYSPKVFAALSSVLPKPQYKQLQRSLTTLRTYKEMQ